jgi:hypothetical protein
MNQIKLFAYQIEGEDLKTGVYYGWCKLREEVYQTVVSVGWNPFYKNTLKTVEAHLLHELEVIALVSFFVIVSFFDSRYSRHLGLLWRKHHGHALWIFTGREEF